MLLFICTAVLAAAILGVKFTKDIFPRPLKRWLGKKAISNWMKSQPQKIGKEITTDPTTYADTGLFPDEHDVAVERPFPIKNPAIRDEYIIYGTDENRNGMCVKMIRLAHDQVQVDLLLTLNDSQYQVSYQGEALSPYEFSLGNLKMEMVEPFKAWRIWYNGIMTQSPRQKMEGKLVHAVFNFLWKGLENPMDNRKNGNPNLLADHLSSIGLFGESLPSLSKIVPEGYSQMGTLHGNVDIYGSHQYNDNDTANPDADQHELYLYGFRTREVITADFDAFPTPTKSRRKDGKGERLELFAMCNENGHGFRLTAYNDEWTDGRMLWASYETTLIQDIDCSPSKILRRALLPALFNIYDSKKTTRVEIWSEEETYKLSNSQITYLKMTINGKEATGVLIQKSKVEPNFNAQGQLAPNSYNLPVSDNCPCGVIGKGVKSENCCDADNLYFLPFSNPACLSVPLVGGKGASLARLQRFASQNSTEVKTARGFCVTTRLFRDLLELEKFVRIFNKSSSSDQTLEESCSQVMEMIKSGDTEGKLSALISPWIEKIFGENSKKIKFAVRSSGVLEDGSDLSSAGQNETFLGIQQDFIAKKVMACWASLFTAQSVGYRLNHGQPAVSEMSVVIQEMVDATTAGVIFTADPRTGNPFQMIITANYGLGESVVSGSCDPDFITLIRHGESQTPVENKDCRDKFHSRFIPTRNKWWRNVTIGKKVLGEKKVKIICTSETGANVAEENSTKEISMSDQESREFCLDEGAAIRLGIVAGEIELFMGLYKPVDIEWAIDQNGQIFILQCRNLTAVDAWTDFELLHELDAPIRTKLDRFTTANTGEVLPKAIHTITQSFNRCLDFTIQLQVYKRKGISFPVSPYRCNSSPLFRQRLFINMFQTLYANVDKEVTPAMVCMDQTIFGRQVIDEEIRKITQERFGLSPGWSKLTELVIHIKFLRSFKNLVEKDYEVYRKFELDYTHLPRKASDVFQKISEDYIHMYNTCLTHMITTQSSSVSQIFLFLFLSEGKKPEEWGNGILEDASRLLTAFQNVESAEIPVDMNHLGDEIMKYGGEEQDIKEKFLDASPEKALEWVKGNINANQALENFFEKHGHRGFSEMDLGEPSWKSNPLSFLPVLRNVLQNKLKKDLEFDGRPKNKTSYKNDDELLDSLSSNLKPMTRRLLKFILPTCRQSVASREKSKSLLVRVIGQFKEKYHYLAQLMVEENLLPSESLIVHLNHFEMGQLVNKDISSSVILQKAMRRQKLYPLVEKLEFPEICHGLPEELDTSIPVTVTDTIQATPVSRGIARGVAKVCMNVHEASENLKPGDILITHGTDIAWSPFFPILGGVVTELGGLISHGAVVAREYGLPCIVGAMNATKIFKTGDNVILDAGKGTLSKVED